MTETQPTPDPKPDRTPDSKPAPTPPPAAKPPASSPAAPKPPSATPASGTPASGTPASAPPPSAPPRHSPAVVLTLLGFILLAGGLAWLWTAQRRLAGTLDPDRVVALEAEVQGLGARLARLENRPAPDLGKLEARVAALESRSPPGLGKLEARVAALEQRAAGPVAPASPSPAVESQIAELQHRLAQAEQAQAGTAARASRLARLQAAAAALDAGQPLGELPGAPPALARFATSKPPTEAALRLAFDGAAARAAEASKPATEADSMAERMWLQIRSLVTVREGDRVLSGAPASYILGQARAQLAAGNLAGAVDAVDHLDKAAAAAMADWRARAQALLDARAALTKLMAAG